MVGFINCKIKELHVHVHVAIVAAYFVSHCGCSFSKLLILHARHMHFHVSQTDNRSIAETAMNQKSSRSHSIFTISLESRVKSDDGGASVRISSLVSLSDKHFLFQFSFYNINI